MPKDNLLSIEASTIFNTLLFYRLCPLSFFFMVGKYWEREEMRFKARTVGTIECHYFINSKERRILKEEKFQLLS